jgi:hypothetical protein
VQAQADKAGDFVRKEFLRNTTLTFQWLCGPGAKNAFESPIEAVFYMWWDAIEAAGHFPKDLKLRPQVPVEVGGESFRLDFQAVPEFHIERYLREANASTPRVAIELDGHDFHERTKEQVIARNRRDRALLTDGWLVLHYSGSELVRDPVATVSDCYNKALEPFWNAYKNG